ncbi:thiamine phosphate synthase [Blastochloris viridis]|uniref:Thiamin-phosphate pyrophosphorylase n=1 Tax=Blastochloris viridis TaxID=1079 RepID=A0A0H5BC40_BLAVI|nr:thiamine phosphate synthase [Blastochloris viridis]ALK08051.1 Thiamine-phosphate synthase [Blastochloris viridis]BAR98689.1 thiamin-phosphate pyrophosphorylase [Blastochloris viridis]CUU43973.1 thiamine-phosphate pyrophosphorylase [Blastochloris viridis]
MRTRLFLITAPVADPNAVIEPLAAALGAADIASVLLRLAEADERTLINRIRAIAPTAQAAGAALLIDGRPDLIARSGADGVHVASSKVKDARALVPADRIVGACGGDTRHDAMVAGEAGADYVMFGTPDGSGPLLDVILERTAWWSQIFEPPCVAVAGDLQEIGVLAAAGADFVALGDALWNGPDGAAAAIRLAASMLRDRVP